MPAKPPAPAPRQQRRPPTRCRQAEAAGARELAVEISSSCRLGSVQDGGIGFGFLIRDGAVGEVLFAQLGARRNIRYRKVSRRHRVGSTSPVAGSCAYARAAVDDANSGALADASAAPQANAVSGSSGALTGSDVTASSCDLSAAMSTPEPTMNRCSRVGLERVQAGDHPGQLRNGVVAGNQLFVDIGDRAVAGVDDGQRRGVGFDEQQGGVRVAGSAAHHLRQRGRGHEGRDQHDVFDLAGGQSLAQHGGVHRVGPGDSGRCQRMAGLVAPSRVPRIVEITRSAALTVAASSSAAMSKLSSSTVTPSAFSPSTKTVRTAVGAIDTPRTTSIAPPRASLAHHGLSGGDHRAGAMYEWSPPRLCGVTAEA